MEPKLPMPSPSPERAPAVGGNKSVEYQGAVSAERTEVGNAERGVEEAREQLRGIGVGENSSVTADPAPVIAVPSIPSMDAVGDDTPLVAADDDLIEQEWVNKAKKIVVATRDDPYLQEREVSKLQANYLQKRYGKELRLSN